MIVYGASKAFVLSFADSEGKCRTLHPAHNVCRRID